MNYKKLSRVTDSVNHSMRVQDTEQEVWYKRIAKFLDVDHELDEIHDTTYVFFYGDEDKLKQIANIFPNPPKVKDGTLQIELFSFDEEPDYTFEDERVDEFINSHRASTLADSCGKKRKRVKDSEKKPISPKELQKKFLEKFPGSNTDDGPDFFNVYTPTKDFSEEKIKFVESFEGWKYNRDFQPRNYWDNSGYTQCFNYEGSYKDFIDEPTELGPPSNYQDIVEIHFQDEGNPKFSFSTEKFEDKKDAEKAIEQAMEEIAESYDEVGLLDWDNWGYKVRWKGNKVTITINKKALLEP